MKNFSFFFLFLFAVLGCSEEVSNGEIYEKGGLALGGYDVVAYFEQGEPREGIPEEAIEYEGLVYYFNSTKNRKLFEQNPEKYLPQYGGWCAYAIAEGPKKMAPDPTLWKIQEGQLLLFYDDWTTTFHENTLEKWEKEPDLMKVRADKNWPQIKK